MKTNTTTIPSPQLPSTLNLRDYFAMAADPAHWTAPIDAVVPLHEAPLVAQAVALFTGLVTIVERLPHRPWMARVLASQN